MAAPKDPARLKAMAAVQSIFDRYRIIAAKRPKHHIDFDRKVMEAMKLIDAGPEGSVHFELLIDEQFSNLNDVMHGGAAGVIFDMSTTTALGPLQKPNYWLFLGGVTRSLNISYLRAVPIGTTVRLKSWVVQHGRTMAMIRGEMTSLDGKTIYCVAEHHKVNVPMKPEHTGTRLPWDDEMEKELQEADNKTKSAAKL